eukprot:6918515-Pyramimonas_sp.AAC.1
MLLVRDLAPALVVLRASAHNVPVGVLALVGALLLQVLEGKVPPPGVVEDACSQPAHVNRYIHRYILTTT